MNLFQDHNKVFGFLLLVVLLNIFLVYTNYTKNITIRSLITKNEQTIKSPLPSEIYDLSELDLRNDLNLVLLYPKDYCGACVNLDLQFLREVAGKYPGLVYVVDNDLDYNMVSIIDEKSEKVSLANLPKSPNEREKWSVDLPRIFLVDSTGLVLLEYESVFGATSEQKLFFDRVNSLMAIAYK